MVGRNFHHFYSLPFLFQPSWSNPMESTMNKVDRSFRQEEAKSGLQPEASFSSSNPLLGRSFRHFHSVLFLVEPSGFHYTRLNIGIMTALGVGKTRGNCRGKTENWRGKYINAGVIVIRDLEKHKVRPRIVS